MFKKSFTSDFCGTYNPGPLTLGSEDFLKVYAIEVWGFPDEHSHNVQGEYRRVREKKKQSNARRTKNALVSGSFNQVYFVLKICLNKLNLTDKSVLIYIV